MPNKKVWLDYDQAQLDFEYDQSTLVPDLSEYRTNAVERSDRAQSKLECRLDVPYGPGEKERLDVFPAASRGAPVVVFIHGGAWRQADKATTSYLAEPIVAAGAAFVSINFGLVPDVNLDEQLRQSRAAVAWVHEHAASLNADPNRIFVAGTSSGGHHVGMLMTTRWSDHGLSEGLIKGGLATSGMYDLEPVRLSARNDYLELDDAAVERNSPIRHLPKKSGPFVIAYGEFEHREFRRQSIVFAATWRAAGLPCVEYDLTGLNHFETGPELANEDGSLLRALLEMLGL